MTGCNEARPYGRSCRCCGGQYSRSFDVAAWRSPDWSTFSYGECARCGSLNLIDDVDAGPFYAAGYWGSKRPTGASSLLRRGLGRAFEVTVMRRTLLARLVSRPLRRPEWLVWLAASGLSLDSPILDIGCGHGRLLGELSRWGFSDLTGVDPFLDADQVEKSGVRLQARSLAQVERADYSVAIFHHSLEHVDNPIEMLRLARGRLAGDGSRVVVALPIAQGPVWERYRDNWWALDAPLHRFVPTVDGLRHMADAADLEFGAIHPSSPAHHVIGSEMVSRRQQPNASPNLVMGHRELKALRSYAASMNSVSRCPQLSVVMTPKRAK